MPRYIDADAAKIDAEERGGTLWLTDGDVKEVKRFLDDQPTANVAPVVYAHWIPKKEMIRSPEAKNYNCSACVKESFAYPNCPFCRAIMDGEESEK